jgi:hypothetical protein
LNKYANIGLIFYSCNCYKYCRLLGILILILPVLFRCSCSLMYGAFMLWGSVRSLVGEHFWPLYRVVAHPAVSPHIFMTSFKEKSNGRKVVIVTRLHSHDLCKSFTCILILRTRDWHRFERLLRNGIKFQIYPCITFYFFFCSKISANMSQSVKLNLCSFEL